MNHLIPGNNQCLSESHWALGLSCGNDFQRHYVLFTSSSCPHFYIFAFALVTVLWEVSWVSDLTSSYCLPLSCLLLICLNWSPGTGFNEPESYHLVDTPSLNWFFFHRHHAGLSLYLSLGLSSLTGGLMCSDRCVRGWFSRSTEALLNWLPIPLPSTSVLHLNGKRKGSWWESISSWHRIVWTSREIDLSTSTSAKLFT